MRRSPCVVRRNLLTPFVIAAALATLSSLVAVGQARAPSSAQDSPQPTPTFRGGVEAVVVDVYVSDKNGNPVPDLTVDDFEVFENGRLQSITTFTNVDIPLERAEQFWPGAEPDVLTNTGPPGRMYMIILDGSVGEAMALRARQVIRPFFEKYFGDNDLAAIVMIQGLATDGQDFTNNRRLLLAALDKFSGVEPPGDLFKRIYLQDLQERMELFARMPGQRKAVLWITGTIGFDPYAIMDYQGGIPTLKEEYAHSAMAAATRGNIRMYPISPAGGTGDGDAADFLGIGTAMDFRALAELTGGFAHANSSDFTNAFERLVRETSTYYVIGFNSSQPRRSGRFARFEVKVKRPGLEVRARPGVVEPLDYVRRRQKPEPSQPPVAAALGAPVAIAGVPMRVVATTFKDQGSNAMVALTLDIADSGLQFNEKAGQDEAKLEIRHLATDARNKLYPEFRHSTTLRLSAAARQHVGDNGLRVVSEFGLPPGRYQLRVASAGGVRTGSVVYDLDVPDYRVGPLMMSGVALTTERDAEVFTLQADVGDRFVKPRDCRPPTCAAEVRVGKTITAWSGRSSTPSYSWTGVLPAPPTTAREFTWSDTVTAFVELYDNNKPSQRDEPYSLDVVARLRNTEGAVVWMAEEQRSSQSAKRPSGGHAFVIRIPLTEIADGPYLLEVEGRSERDPAATVSRRVPIRIQ